MAGDDTRAALCSTRQSARLLGDRVAVDPERAARLALAALEAVLDEIERAVDEGRGPSAQGLIEAADHGLGGRL